MSSSLGWLGLNSFLTLDTICCNLRSWGHGFRAFPLLLMPPRYHWTGRSVSAGSKLTSQTGSCWVGSFGFSPRNRQACLSPPCRWARFLEFALSLRVWLYKGPALCRDLKSTLTLGVSQGCVLPHMVFKHKSLLLTPPSAQGRPRVSSLAVICRGQSHLFLFLSWELSCAL